MTDDPRPARKPVTKKALATPIPRPMGVRPVAVTGAFIDGVQAIYKTAATLHLVSGQLGGPDEEDGQKVLVPFAEVRLGGHPIGSAPADADDPDGAPPTLFATSMPLENLAFVLLDLTNELRRACSDVGSLGNGRMGVDKARMSAVRYFVAHLEREAHRCRVTLDRAFPLTAPGEATEPAG